MPAHSLPPTLDDERPDDDAAVVRFGDGNPWDLAWAAWKYACGRGDGSWGLSVFWWYGLSTEEIARRAAQLSIEKNGANALPHTHMRLWSRRALHEFDFLIEVRKTYGPGHYTLQLPAFLLDKGFDPNYPGDKAACPAYLENRDYFDELASLLGPKMINPARKL